jgi:hypothetical protein
MVTTVTEFEVYEHKMLMKIFGNKNELYGHFMTCFLRNVELSNLYRSCSVVILKSCQGTKDLTYSWERRDKKRMQNFGGEYQLVDGPLGRLKRREDNIHMDLIEIGS